MPWTIVPLSAKPQIGECRSSAKCAVVEWLDHHCGDDLVVNMVKKCCNYCVKWNFVSNCNNTGISHFSNSNLVKSMEEKVGDAYTSVKVIIMIFFFLSFFYLIVANFLDFFHLSFILTMHTDFVKILYAVFMSKCLGSFVTTVCATGVENCTNWKCTHDFPIQCNKKSSSICHRLVAIKAPLIIVIVWRPLDHISARRWVT